jgi:hypothetical protein
MHAVKRLSPGGAVLTALLALLTSDASAPAAARDARRDPTKKPTATGLVPEGKKLTARQLAAHIDKVIEAKVKGEKVSLSPLTDDAEFLRRVYLDLTGKIPTAGQAASFLDEKDPAKRGKLIDELLAGREYGRHMADLWQALLLPRVSDNRRMLQYYPNMVKWLQGQFNANTGWDKMTREVLTASGAVNKTGPVVYWLANPTADKATDNVTRMFLGVQLQCAQCHNHPFTDWKQNEYWHMAAFFTRVRPDGNPQRAARNGGTITISETPRRVNRRGLPPSAKLLPPKFLGGEQPNVKPNEPVRPVLAEWMTSPSNPYFARAMVNRVWAQLFGRGFVNPIDDMHDGNPCSHPELLADLSKQFGAHGFDVKHLFRSLCNSQTYQRSSRSAGNNLDASPELFARMAVKPLSPGQMFDSLTQLAGNPADRPGRARGGIRRFGGSLRDVFVASFGIEDGADPTEYQAGIPQVLRLMNAPQLNRPALLVPILRSSKNKAEVVEKLYLTVLSRRPTDEERRRIDDFLRKNADEPRAGYAGVLWALMNSSEFALNR